MTLPASAMPIPAPTPATRKASQSPARWTCRYNPPSTRTSASSSQVSRSTLGGQPRPSAAVSGATAEPAKPPGPGRHDRDAVGLDAAICLARAGDGHRLAFLQVRRLPNDGLPHDHALVEGDLDVGVAAGIVDGEAVIRQVGDRAAGASAGRGSGCAGAGARARAGTGRRRPAAPAQAVAGRPCAGGGCRGVGGRAATADLVAAVETAE